MLYRYYIEVKHTPKYKNGAFRKTIMSFKARTPVNALRQAVEYCKDNEIEAVGFDIALEGIPINRKIRHKWLKQKRLNREQEQQYIIQRLAELSETNAF